LSEPTYSRRGYNQSNGNSRQGSGNSGRGSGGGSDLIDFHAEIEQSFFRKSMALKFMARRMVRHESNGPKARRSGVLYYWKGNGGDGLKNGYDWENRVAFSMKVEELGNILAVLKGFAPEYRTVHDPASYGGSGDKKTLSVSPDDSGSGVWMSLQEGKGKPGKRSFKMDHGEVQVLSTLIEHAITWIAQDQAQYRIPEGS